MSSKGNNAGKMQRARRRKLVWLQEQKAKPCMDCGGEFPPVCMDFDHVRGTKDAPLSVAVTNCWSEERMLREIAKCDLVCSNCHRIRTDEKNHYGRKKTKNPLRGGRPKSTT